jgi:hypothetical protein
LNFNPLNFRRAGVPVFPADTPVAPDGPKSSPFLIGLDLGQQSDPTALAILKKTTLLDPDGKSLKDARNQDLFRLDVIHLIRFPLGTSYPSLVVRVVDLLKESRVQAPGKPRLAIDATGVGRPVVDLFLDAAPAAELVPVTITGGTQTVKEPWNRTHAVSFKVPKVELVSTVQAGLQTGRLKIAPGLELADTLRAELVAFQVKVSAAGHESFNGRTGIHDDLVLSVALAAWLGSRPVGKIIRVAR